MKKKLTLIIVICASLGILFNIINLVLENPSTAFTSGLSIFKYFTILSNLLVSIYFLALSSLKKLNENINFKRGLGAVTIYVTITFVVFLMFLQPTYHPTGFAKASSILCHYITPILTLGYMIYYSNEYEFFLKDILYWLIFPVSYIVFVLLYGNVTSDYIYPFFQLEELGLVVFLINFIGLLLFFVCLSVGVVYLTKHKKTT